jgi:hypothetical protein
MPVAPSWATPGSQVPNWLAQQQHQPPPTSAQSYTYGQYPPALTPISWNVPTPAGSWGPPTPAGSWGPPTPASANGNGANWVQHQEYYTPFGQESSGGQPVGPSPWFGAGDGRAGGAGPSRKRSKRRSKHHTPDQQQQQLYQQHALMHMQQNPYPQTAPLQRSSSHELPGSMGYPLQRSSSWGGGPRYGYTIASTGYPQSEEYNARNLARRPRDWRPDFDPRGGLASYMPRVGRPRTDVTGTSPFPLSLHVYLDREHCRME